jgi:hypothetical protein
MSTRNLVLGACAACLAVGSAVASHLATIIIKVKLSNGDIIFVDAPTGFTCSGAQNICAVRVETKTGALVDATATVLTTTDGNALGSANNGITVTTR